MRFHLQCLCKVSTKCITIMNLHVKGTYLLVILNVKYVVVSGTSIFRENSCCKYFFILHFIFMQIKKSKVQYLLKIFLAPRFYYEKLPIICYFLLVLRNDCTSANNYVSSLGKISLRLFMEKIQNISYLNYVRRNNFDLNM